MIRYILSNPCGALSWAKDRPLDDIDLVEQTWSTDYAESCAPYTQIHYAPLFSEEKIYSRYWLFHQTSLHLSIYNALLFARKCFNTRGRHASLFSLNYALPKHITLCAKRKLTGVLPRSLRYIIQSSKLTKNLTNNWFPIFQLTGWEHLTIGLLADMAVWSSRMCGCSVGNFQRFTLGYGISA